MLENPNFPSVTSGSAAKLGYATDAIVSTITTELRERTIGGDGLD